MREMSLSVVSDKCVCVCTGGRGVFLSTDTTILCFFFETSCIHVVTLNWYLHSNCNMSGRRVHTGVRSVGTLTAGP